MGGGKKKKGALGSGLIKQRFRGRDPRAKKDGILHTTTLNDGYDWTKMGSCTEQRDLDDFLSTAQLAGTDFTAERLHVSFVEGMHNEGATSDKRKKEVADAKKSHGHQLRVPRRPPWTRDMTKEELQQNETNSFLDWRRSLASLSDLSTVVVTPFERNLEFWRQLWRVIERSDLVVQVVDARNPLLFRCPDLEQYVKEISEKKNCMLVLNKADLLTLEQRKIWAQYFVRNHVEFAFFSAFLAGGTEDASEDKTLAKEAARDAHLAMPDNEVQTQIIKDELELGVADLSDAVADVLAVTPDTAAAPADADAPAADAADTAATGDAMPGTPVDTGAGAAASDVADGAAALDPGVPLGLDEGVPLDVDGTPLAAADGAVGGGAGEAGPVPDRAEASLEELCYVHTSIELLTLFKSKAPDVVDEDGNAAVPNIGMVGYPNVGKSSTINALCAVKYVPVSSTPGRTRHFQTILLGDCTLCDCPGLVFPNFANTKAEMVCNGILPIHQLTDHIGPTTHVCETVSREQLEKAYGFSIIRPAREDTQQDRPPTAHELLDSYGNARGMMNGRGDADGPRCARTILKDYVEGAKLRHCARPPDDDVQPGQASDKVTQNRDNGFKVVGTHGHNRQYVSEIDEEFFSQSGVRALSRGYAKDLSQPMATGKGSKKHNKKNRKEKTRRVQDRGANRGMAGINVVS